MPITCMENVVSNAERRAIANREGEAVPRWPTSTLPCPRSPASSSLSTKAK
jgi:hypothetical protein